MTEIELTCRYCGNKWNTVAYGKAMVEEMVCGKCGDGDLTVRPVSVHTGDVFGYNKGVKDDGET